MQFEPDFRFDMDDGFASMCGPCPSTTNSFSSAASSAYDPFTPTSRRSTPNELHLDLDGCAFNPHGHASHHHSPLDMTPPSTAVPKYFMGGPVKHEHGDHMPPFADSLPTTPMKRMDSFSTEYDLLDLNSQLGTMTPSHSSYTINPEAAMGPSSYMMTPTQSLSGSEMADSSSSWSVPNESPIQFFSRDMSLGDVESLDLDRHSVSPLHHPAHSHYRAAGPDRRMMLHEAQRKTSELQRAQQMRATRKRPAPGAAKPDSGSVDVVRRAMCKCDYPGCHKAFRRNEHLKRHKQTYVLSLFHSYSL